MDDVAAKADLKRYLERARSALVFKLDGLGDYDSRRPLVPTGTNLLGLLKHCAHVEYGYFCLSFDRPCPSLPAWDDGAETNIDMYATADESRISIEDFYRDACAAADETIDSLDLDAPAEVPWWPANGRRTTLHRLLVHVIAETDRHAGHADLVRELIDGAAGISPDFSNLPDVDASYWPDYVSNLEAIAATFRP
jgi:uncharacterized damage-inducible protein DinB